MNGSILDRLQCRVRCARMSRVLRPLVGAVILSATTTGANAEWQTGPFAMACALKEVKVITLIEDHADAGDLPSDSLGDARLAMLRARLACYEGRVGEALALYDGILNLGPVVSFRKP
jgi:hypothetical protein